MAVVRARRRAPVLIAVAVLVSALVLTACGGDAATPNRPSPTPLPSGELGVVTPDAASAAVLGLCEVMSQLPEDPEAASATFDDRVHEELHIVAAATQVQDRTAAAALLRAKERVEADLAGPGAADAGSDVDALLKAVRSALAVIGLTVPDCRA